MDQAAVAHINFGRFDQAFAHIGMPRRQAAPQQQSAQQVDVALRSFGIHAHVARQLRHIEQSTLIVGQHGPKVAQGSNSQFKIVIEEQNPY